MNVKPQCDVKLEHEPDILDQIDLTSRASETREPANPHSALVGECSEERHPTLTGRVRIRWKGGDGQSCEEWLATLHGITVRVADRVMLLHPANWPEPIIVGVVDGFAVRPEYARVPGPSVPLARDEACYVTTVDGEKLLEIYQTESGPVVRLLTGDVNLELSGKLRIEAESIELNAKKGGATITATDDIVLRGEMIALN